MNIRHIVVPVAIIIREGKILLNKRNDPDNSEFHGLWEFPGGSVEYGETVEECVARETLEETGYVVSIVEAIKNIQVKRRQSGDTENQLYIMPYVCKIVGGDGKWGGDEVLEARWYDLDEVPNLNLFAGDGEMYRTFLPELEKIISEKHL